MPPSRLARDAPRARPVRPAREPCRPGQGEVVPPGAMAPACARRSLTPDRPHRIDQIRSRRSDGGRAARSGRADQIVGRAASSDRADQIGAAPPDPVAPIRSGPRRQIRSRRSDRGPRRQIRSRRSDRGRAARSDRADQIVGRAARSDRADQIVGRAARSDRADQIVAAPLDPVAPIRRRRAARGGRVDEISVPPPGAGRAARIRSRSAIRSGRRTRSAAGPCRGRGCARSGR